MEITNRGVSSAPLASQTPVEAATLTSGDSAAPSATPSGSTYTPSPELVRLLDQVRAQTAVRIGRIQAAVERLQQGYYNSPASITQTAEAICHCSDC